jgi:vacuolar-type H+-ATPase subunit H
MTVCNRTDIFRELAMYYEHREKNYQKAREVALEGLALASETSQSLREDFSRRLERLQRKIIKQEKRQDSG